MDITASIITQFWQDQIVDQNRQGIFLVLLSFEASFLFIRTSARLTRSVSWWPGGVQTESGVHLHHLVWGICLVLIAGALGFTFRYDSPWWELTAVAFGIGAGLTLDEFALWVYLKDVYWADQGRKSLDAVAIATVFMGLVLLGSQPFELEPGPAIGIVVSVVISLVMCTICFAKERLIYGLVGIFFPIFGLIGAVRLGKPGSPWAKWRYGKRNPSKQTHSQERFDDATRRANELKEKLFDLIGGKPSEQFDARECAKREHAAQQAQQDAADEVKRRAQQGTP